ncbi:MAG: ABC transporter ATP-binding protein [Desulfobacterales bacterium]|nr:ABC transporter ATP-binding protein [Desulfobacterales bacterium]
MLKLENVSVHYGQVNAIDDISIEVKEGSITTLIGSNGAGKSTCLRAISGLAPLTEGKIYLNDERIDGLTPEQIVSRGIVHVPEGKHLFLEMNILDNLLIGAFLRNNEDEIKKDLNEVFEYFPDLKIAKNREASKLSGGQQQMLAIGRGLMAKPKILLLDEPSLGISPLLTKEVALIIKQISTKNISILLIEQNASLALKLSDKGYVLETGRIVFRGTNIELQNNEHIKKAYLGL